MIAESDFIRAACELHEREHDGLALFRPTGIQESALREMAKDHIFEVLIKAGNRAGKTVLAAAFFASFVRDVPIRTWDGDEIHCRPSWLRGKPVNVWVIGDHLKHLGMTIYRILFEENPSQGLFRIILDEDTGIWRAWNPGLFPRDAERKSETRWAPPIIPPHTHDPPAWAPGRAREHEFRTVRMHDGSTIHGFASSGEVKQGDACHLIWNDENIVNKPYYEEWRARLREDEGMIIWSTMPRDDCYVFNTVIDRMENDQRDIDSGEMSPEDQRSLLVTLSFLDSPFIPDRQKEMALAQSGDREAAVRIFGERSTRLISVYQDYDRSYHVVDYGDDRNDRVTEEMRKNNWIPPSDWTRELVLDPGTQKPAVLLCAVPPPSFWDHDEPYFVIYREIFIRRASPSKIAQEVLRTEHGFRFERFIVDGRMGRQKPPGFTETVEYQYEKAFRVARLFSRQTGSGFIHGDDNFSRRSNMVIRALRQRECGRPQVRIVNQACPNLVRQMMSNVRKTAPDGEPLEEPAANQVDDCRVCLEYWISRRPTWHEPDRDEPLFTCAADEAYARLVEDHKSSKRLSGEKDSTIYIGVPA